MGIPPQHGTLVPLESAFSGAQVELYHLYGVLQGPCPSTLFLTQQFTIAFPPQSCPSLELFHFLQEFVLFMLSGLIAPSGKILLLLIRYQSGLKLLAVVPSAYSHHCGFEEKVPGLTLNTKVPKLVAHVALDLVK